MPRARTLFLLGLLLAALALWWARDPAVLAGTATVTDGDSLRVRGEAVRLKGVDAPELAQTCEGRRGDYPCGEVARRGLERLVDGRRVTCRLAGRDRYKRHLARCTAGEGDLGAAMVAQGLAVGYRGHAAEEREARAAGRGLWAGRFERPSDWRASHGLRGGR